MNEKLLSYGVCFQEQNEYKSEINNLNNQVDYSSESKKNESETKKLNEEIEIEFYDETLQFDENFEDGNTVKYVLLPIYKDNNNEEKNYTKLLNLGSKILMNRKKVMDKFSEGLNYFVLDYDSIFGLRLLSFQKYKPDFFSCEERVLFETLLIKFHQFKFKEFFYSYNTIHIELGIKKDKANTIVKKFVRLGFLNCNIKTSLIDGRPSQVTYYFVNACKIIELIPLIYKNEHLEQVNKELTMYLEPAIEKKSNRTIHPIDITRIMQ
ncbi:hypothetical protein [Flavobacterium aciduliphilum]|uniref:Uncharacterized protein n=1 Tax=Flavobacterium aciduliphilum TaxID=1101402 RepID=A0A328YM67_9FLAO|nr:hypothetical protein [Flavobacterium aciduliphilum]RAR74233.1 hypothetical protein CLV55_102166 [Flavobacterium aciduliphilum]